jgi:succinate-semialdehyde dehydrogenase/glutarate-semialdehyde dehydrogenase
MTQTSKTTELLRMYINGEWVVSDWETRFELMSPATGESFCSVVAGSREDAKKALDSAYDARDRARKMPTYEKAKLLHRVASIIDSKKEKLARELAIEQGKPYRAESLPEIEETAENFRIAAEDAKRLDGRVMPSRDPNKTIMINYVPYGVFTVITPWNYPYLIHPEYIAPAIATGNTVVFKPSSYVVRSAVRLVQCLEEAGVPKGFVNLVLSDGDFTGKEAVGDEIITNDKVAGIGLTGHTSTGEMVSRRAGMKKLLLECGGLGPMVVLDDADVGRAASAAATASFSNSGQVCCSAERVLVHDGVYEKFLEGLKNEAKHWKLGHPLEEGVLVGPMNNEPTAAKVDQHIADGTEKGARVLLGGGRASGFPTNLYYEPTVMADVTRDMLFNKDETFGPVAPVMRFGNLSEAVEIANGTQYGLQASVFTSNISKAFRFVDEIQTGQVLVNESPLYWEAQEPFGGLGGKKSGIGRLGGVYTAYEMSNLKTIVIDKS